jgi:hypothetical protein
MAYITYLTDPDQHSNAATTYPGLGETKEESRRNACYYNNQWPWVVTVAASKAPRWAQRQARDSRRHELEGKSLISELTGSEMNELEAYYCQEVS